jgi:LytS/YehU family sensor histidine kinase
MHSFKQSAQNNPPDDINLALKRYMDNQTIILIIISYFFLRNILTNTELKHFTMNFGKILKRLIFSVFRRHPTYFGLYMVIIREVSKIEIKKMAGSVKDRLVWSHQ